MKQTYLLIILLLSLSLKGQNALDFDGSNDWISIQDQNSLDLLANDNISIEFWFKTTFNGFKPIINKFDTNDGFRGYGVALYGGGVLGIAKIGNPGTFAQINTSTGGFNDGNWHHFTGIMLGTDPNNYKIYIDGALQTPTIRSNNYTGTLTNSVPLRIGSDASTYFLGSLDEIRIWSKGLSASEVNSQWNKELTGNESNLVAYYNFNQGVKNGNNASVTTLNDATSNNNNGTLNNFTLNGSTSNWVDGVNFSTLSTQNNILASPISLFPNPSSNVIKFNNLTSLKSYTIYNTLGREISKGNISMNETLDISSYSSGLYFLKFDNGNTFKFIKN